MAAIDHIVVDNPPTIITNTGSLTRLTDDSASLKRVFEASWPARFWAFLDEQILWPVLGVFGFPMNTPRKR